MLKSIGKFIIFLGRERVGKHGKMGKVVLCMAILNVCTNVQKVRRNA